MLLWLFDGICALYPAPGALAGTVGVLRAAPRIVAAAVLVFLASLLVWPYAIRWLRVRFGEPVKSGSAMLDQLHRAKANTPTMGGLVVVAGIAFVALTLADLASRYVLLALLVVVALALVGAVDDLVKLRTTATGLDGRVKLLCQTAVGLAAATCIYYWQLDAPQGTILWLPGGATVELGWLAIPLATIAIVGSSNAVNLADGLDGLAAGCVALATLAVAAGMIVFCGDEVRELAIVAAAMIGGLGAFLCFNRHPARVFMGNVGSLSLGGLLGLLAAASGLELVLVVAGGVFVAEAASVVLQVGCYRWTKKRVLRCAPLHHHFEFAGWPEGRVVTRFWMAGAACALLSMAVMLAGVRAASPEGKPPATVAGRDSAPRR
ncbi:MAG: phospho-N-acetylmuramoyl-pentapeptide-transferase [Planctomycetia bacterium]|nr:phospho-N-acetylmuramoyl-pentapeptide-transferase [Planctomycetia bacterium]